LKCGIPAVELGAFKLWSELCIEARVEELEADSRMSKIREEEGE
jgi:hypothetical protein